MIFLFADTGRDLANTVSPVLQLIIRPPLKERMYPLYSSRRSSFASGITPCVGRPDARTTFFPRSCAFMSAAFVLGVITLSRFVSVPSRSRTMIS